MFKLFFYFTFQVSCSKCIIVNDCHSVMIAFMLSWLNCEVFTLTVIHSLSRTYCILMFEMHQWNGNIITVKVCILSIHIHMVEIINYLYLEYRMSINRQFVFLRLHRPGKGRVPQLSSDFCACAVYWPRSSFCPRRLKAGKANTSERFVVSPHPILTEI